MQLNDGAFIQTGDNVYIDIDSGASTSYYEGALRFRHGSVTRFAIEKDNVANADLYIRRYNASGVLQDSPISIAGDTGLTTMILVTFGTSGSPQTVTYDGVKPLSIYTTCASTNASTSYEPVLINTVMTGAGQVGGRLRVNMETNVALGGWANALKASVDCKTNGRATGLLSVSCHEITMPASAGGAGTYAVVEVEVTCPASWTGTNDVNMFWLAASGATVANFDDYGYLFTLNGVSSGAGHIWYDNQKAAPAVEEFVRVKTPSGVRYLALYDANA